MDFILREFKIEDVPYLASYANNKKIADNLTDAFPYPYKLCDAEFYIKKVIASDDDKGLFRAIVIDNKAAGSIAVTVKSDVYRKSAELGYWLAEDYWGGGIMSAAVKLFVREAFEKLDIVRIYAKPFAYNIASRKVLQKAKVLKG